MGRLNAGEHVFVGVDGVGTVQRCSHVCPHLRRDVEEGVGFFRHSGQYGRKVNGQNTECFEADAAHAVQFGVLSFDARQFPRFVGVDEYVHRVGQLHDGAHGFAVFACFVQLGDGRAGGAQLQQQFVVHGGIVNFAAEAFEQKAGCAAGDIDVFSDQIRIHTRNEIIEIQVQIFHAGVELGGKIVAQPFGIHAGLDVGVGGDECAARFTHFRAVHGQKAVGEYVGWRAVT